MLIKKSTKGLAGSTIIPGDKSISHRAVMFGALADGITSIEGFLPGEDCLATIACFRKMGVRIKQTGNNVELHGRGLFGLKEPETKLYVGNSGTTIRLLLGILAGQQFQAVITGDSSIERRPMQRVVIPLKLMGAAIDGIENGSYAPLTVKPVARLNAIDYCLPVASAQVKSAILLAGLYANGITTVTEPAPSRNHTELMLRAFGADSKTVGLSTSINGGAQLRGRRIVVPGDISSAAFLIVAALIIPGSDIIIQNVGVNSTRTGIIEVLLNMGGDITITSAGDTDIEPVANIRVRHSRLTGITLGGPIIPRLIDEIPAIAVAAAFAQGDTKISDAQELRVKETDRITALAKGLKKMGAAIRELPDGLIITGGSPLTGAEIESFNDHRIAMAFAVAGMAAAGKTSIPDDSCVAVSFPNFHEIFALLGGNIVN